MHDITLTIAPTIVTASEIRIDPTYFVGTLMPLEYDRDSLRKHCWQYMDELFNRPMRGRFIHSHKGKKPKRGNPCRRTFRR